MLSLLMAKYEQIVGAALALKEAKERQGFFEVIAEAVKSHKLQFIRDVREIIKDAKSRISKSSINIGIINQ
ncbi:MAG: hypothetical protein LBT45_00820 [Rickettsiales bacterium]|jgi:ribosomal protein L7/L12|nr:hypothetical protein [Rickettsiales bacterium]